jgi:hypothetical protein
VLRKHTDDCNYPDKVPADEEDEPATMAIISTIFDITEERLQRNLCFDRETIKRALLEPLKS